MNVSREIGHNNWRIRCVGIGDKLCIKGTTKHTTKRATLSLSIIKVIPESDFP